MNEYTVRYNSNKSLISVCSFGKTVKYSYLEAIRKANELLTRPDVNYCKIYKGRSCIYTVYRNN